MGRTFSKPNTVSPFIQQSYQEKMSNSTKNKNDTESHRKSSLFRKPNLSWMKQKLSRKNSSIETKEIKQPKDKKETDATQQIRQSFVNPMKNILQGRSNGAYVPWSHISKVIAALNITLKEMGTTNNNDDEMTTIMIKQCIQLLQDSPYALNVNGTSLNPAHKLAKSNPSDTKNILTGTTMTRESLEVNSWIHKMVSRHLNIVGTQNNEHDIDQVEYEDAFNEEVLKDASSPTILRSKSFQQRTKGKNGRSSFNMVSDKILLALSNINNWDFDIFEFYNLCGDFTLSIIGVHILKNIGFLSKLKINEEKLSKFLYCIQQGYKTEVPYHNAVHAADVCISLYSLMLTRRFKNSNVAKEQHKKKYTCQLKDALKFRNVEILAVYIGALCHDVGHPGTNNAFQVNAETDLALLYNDQSVLENLHIATSFKVLAMEGNNFVENTNIDRKKMRKLMTQLILHTDMAFHNKVVEEMLILKNTKIKEDSAVSPSGRAVTLSLVDGDGENVIIREMNASLAIYDESNQSEMEWTETQRCDFLCALMHACDISNLAKKNEHMYEWVLRLYNEFYQQGDKEKELGLPVSEICDRQHPKIQAANIGFGNFIVRPLFEAIRPFYAGCDLAINNLDRNIKFWEEQKTKKAQNNTQNNEPNNENAKAIE